EDFSKLSNGQLKIFDLIVNEGLNVFYTGIKGDFWQSSIKKQRISKYCFEAESWRCLNYCIRLTKTYENKDPKLTRVLNDIRDETLSHKTNNIIKNLQKTPKYPNDDIKVSELLSDSGKVNSINNKRLRMIQNKLYEYTAVDNVLGDDNDRHIKCFVENEREEIWN
ncbi:5540_t:CDS:2, partial [Entrophospora sp. SA101]